MTITFALVLGHSAWSLEISFDYDTWESQESWSSRVLEEEHARLLHPTVEAGKVTQYPPVLLDRMVEAMDDFAHDPTNSITDEVMAEYQNARNAMTIDPTTRPQCAICGIGVTVPHQHDVDMCGQCHLYLKDLPPITYISDGHGITRAFTFGSGIEAFAVVMSFAKMGRLARHEIGSALAQQYRRATAPEPAAPFSEDTITLHYKTADLRSDEVLPGVTAEESLQGRPDTPLTNDPRWGRPITFTEKKQPDG